MHSSAIAQDWGSASPAVLAAMSRSLSAEAEVLTALPSHIDLGALNEAVVRLSRASLVVTCASGSSGYAAAKFAHSLCCVERAAKFMPPSDAIHGGMGCIHAGERGRHPKATGNRSSPSRSASCLRNTYGPHRAQAIGDLTHGPFLSSWKQWRRDLVRRSISIRRLNMTLPGIVSEDSIAQGGAPRRNRGQAPDRQRPDFGSARLHPIGIDAKNTNLLRSIICTATFTEWTR